MEQDDVRNVSEEASELIPLAQLEEGPLAGYWRKPEGGFKWVSGVRPIELPAHDPSSRQEPGPWLVPTGDLAVGYPVLRRARLLDDFIELGRDPSLEHILMVANSYGSLGRDEKPLEIDGRVVLAASLAVWRYSAGLAATLWELWQRVVAGQREALAPFIHWQESPRRVSLQMVSIRGRPDVELSKRVGMSRELEGYAFSGYLPDEAFSQIYSIADDNHDPHKFLSRLRFGDPVEPMRHYVTQTVNLALSGHIRRVVLPDYGYSVRYLPDSLLTTVYLRLQDRIAGASSREQTCANPACPVGRFVRTRRDQRYCSKSCRQMASYYRTKGDMDE